MKNRRMNALWSLGAVMVTLAGAATASGAGSLIALDRTMPNQVLLGDVFEYQIKITNVTDVDLKELVVTESVAANFKYESAVPAPDNVAGTQLVWNLGTLARQSSRVIQIKGSATQEGVVENCNSLRVSYDLEDCARTQVVRPQLALTKTGPTEVLLCDPIPVELIVTNTGSGAATNVVVQDTLPDGLLTQNGNRVVRSEIGTLGPGESRQINAVLKAGQAGAYENRAAATADRGLRAEATHSVIVRQPRLALTKTGPAKRYLGRNVNYTITVGNTGDGAANNTRVVDTLPAGMSFVSASDGGALAGGTVAWDLGTLAPNASRDVSVKMRADRIGLMKNSVTANAYCAQADAELVTEIVGIPAILLELIDLEDPIEVGANLTYEVVVTNQGSAVGTNIRVTCTLPPEQDYVGSTGPTSATVTGKNVEFAPLASLAPKAKATYKVVITGVGVGDVRFRVGLNSDQMKGEVMETEATRIYE